MFTLCQLHRLPGEFKRHFDFKIIKKLHLLKFFHECHIFIVKKNNVFKWRKDLKVGSKVDALDNLQMWYSATVILIEGDKISVSFDGFS